MIDLVSKRFTFLAVSLLVIIPGVLAIIFGGIKPGIDFTGGTRWEVLPETSQAQNTDKFKQTLTDLGYKDAQVKGATITGNNIVTNTVVMDLPGQIKDQAKSDIEAALIKAGLVAGQTVTETVSTGTNITTTATVTTSTTLTGTNVAASATTTGTTGTTGGTAPPTKTVVRNRIQPNSELEFTSIGPTVGSELLVRAFGAVGLASLVILIYLRLVFRKVPNALRYGVCAIVALLHDVLVVVGVFAILGLLFGKQIDALFVTAMLTVIGFSVHDTIVVFDRVRENIMKRRFERFEDVVNYSLVQTLARSINTSVTVILTLFAMYMFGGVSIRDFVLALLIGIISGTYSSIFNASMLLVIWENREWSRAARAAAPATGGARGTASR